MTLHERADKLLSVREDLYEMHFHKVDREWLIEAMVDFAQQQETLYTEEQVIGFAEWILNSDSKKVLTRTKESLLKEYISFLIKIAMIVGLLIIVFKK